MSWDEGRNETTAVTIAHEQFNIVQQPQVGFVDGRRACVRGGRGIHLLCRLEFCRLVELLVFSFCK